VNWIAADILRVEGGLLVEHWTSSKTKRRGAIQEREPDVREDVPVYS